MGPGPAGYLPADHTSVGYQPQSTRRTSPRPVFEKAPRSKSLKKAARHAVPGPGAYKARGFVGKQHESTKITAPVFSLKGREVFGSTVTSEAASFPGPGTYKTDDIKKQHSKHTTGPTYSFTEATGDGKTRNATPGPGAYKARVSMGTQLLSKDENGCAYSFDRADVNLDEAGENGAELAYVKVSALGKQPQSTRTTLPAWRFGTSHRTEMARKGKGPGPGSYSARGAMGKQLRSNRKSAPACSMSGREKFGSPWHTRRN